MHTYNRIDPYDTLILCVRVAVLTAVTLTVPIVLFPVSWALCLFPPFKQTQYTTVFFNRTIKCAGAQSHPGDVISQQVFQLDTSRQHRLRSAHLHQHAGDICSQHSGHLWHHWLVYYSIILMENLSRSRLHFTFFFVD